MNSLLHQNSTDLIVLIAELHNCSELLGNEISNYILSAKYNTKYFCRIYILYQWSELRGLECSQFAL